MEEKSFIIFAPEWKVYLSGKRFNILLADIRNIVWEKWWRILACPTSKYKLNNFQNETLAKKARFLMTTISSNTKKPFQIKLIVLVPYTIEE
jgi:hypothetical protein